MDDLVVIILTLIIVVVGVLGQLKKKKQAMASSLQPEQSENLWDLVEEGAEIPVQREEPDFIEVIKPKPLINRNDPFYKAKRKTKLKSELAGKAKQKTMKGFSLRKAVVYSEILNRKYT